MHLGEAMRALVIADAYGTRLNAYSRNLANPAALNQLYTKYPSHGFVIDREEAATLFQQVREPSEDELALVEALGAMGRRMQGGASMTNPDHVVTFLTDKLGSDDPSKVQPREAANEQDTVDEAGAPPAGNAAPGDNQAAV